MISRTEELPLEIPELACEYCGATTVVDRLQTEDGRGPGVRHPVPALQPGAVADEWLPDPTPEPTLQERVAELEVEVRWLKARLR